MSARDSESGSSSYKGGSGSAGGLGNGGIGGGMGGGGNYGGGMGGGAGRNGGIGSRTGVTTGNTWRGTSAFGRPGGPAMGYGMSPAAAREAASMQGIMARLQNRPQQQGVPTPVAAPPPAAVPPPQRIIGYLPGWPGTGMWWGNQPPYQNNPGLMTHQTPPQSAPPNGKYQDRVPSGVGPGGWPGQGGGPHWGRTESAPYGGVGNRGNTGGGGGGGDVPFLRQDASPLDMRQIERV